MDALIRYFRRHRWARRSLTGLSVVLILEAIGLLGYPLYTNLHQDRIQHRLVKQIATPEPGDDRLAATAAHADRDLVLHPRGVQQVAVELAAGERARLHDLRQPQRRAPAGCVRRKQGVIARGPDERLERAGGLRPDRGRLVIDRARGKLDTIPRQDIRGNELGERLERLAPELGLRPGTHDRSGEPVRGAHIGVGEPRHGDTRNVTPAARPRQLPSPSFGCSLSLGLRWSVE